MYTYIYIYERCRNPLTWYAEIFKCCLQNGRLHYNSTNTKILKISKFLWPDLYICYIWRPHMGTFKLHISCTQAMCLQPTVCSISSIHRERLLAAPLYTSLACCICCLYCRLHTDGLYVAYVQLKWVNMWPSYAAKYIDLVTRVFI